ncbi:DUF455 domain protein [Hypoxylon trugodes]|uniref:DUF455 domain protein n=1 Tax=Hypoxylon trugodes TaxID=326681 RepID=UPI0021911F14|nr:DUF455 domain protein [Hypoxylon trugodes]KAI1387663.1 DUF455 domain protein [Hypoxylon trugodes]
MQGFNMGRYVPPDVEGTTTGNKLHKKRPPGISQSGEQTIRFEMPFAVWCTHCPQPTIIGQGVRFNAIKKRVGSYHSTPIFSFRMRHASCGGTLEIRTDPANTTYVVVEGGRKRDVDDKLAATYMTGGVEPILTDKEREDLRTNAFAKLEKTIADRRVVEEGKVRIDELADESARKWEDPYERNRKLRAAFRVGRQERERDEARTVDLKDRMSLGIELLAASEEDARRAALVDFGPSSDGGQGQMGRKALAKPLFATGANGSNGGDSKDDGKKTKNKRLKSEIAAAQTRDSLVSEIMDNTRVSQDPFLALDRGNGETTKGSSRILGIKRKRPEQESGLDEEGTPNSSKMEKEVTVDVEKGEKTVPSTALVEYDSD